MICGKNYNLNFIEGYGVQKTKGISLDFVLFLTINNGYLITFQYLGDMSYESIADVRSIIKSVNYTNNTTNLSNNIFNPMKLFDMNETKSNMFTQEKIPKLLALLLITALSYMIFPVVRLVINKNKFDKKIANRIAIWNSIVVGLIFLALNAENGGQWSAAQAIFYYFINKAILTEKNKETEYIEDNKDIENT